MSNDTYRNLLGQLNKEHVLASKMVGKYSVGAAAVSLYEVCLVKIHRLF